MVLKTKADFVEANTNSKQFIINDKEIFSSFPEENTVKKTPISTAVPNHSRISGQ